MRPVVVMPCDHKGCKRAGTLIIVNHVRWCPTLTPIPPEFFGYISDRPVWQSGDAVKRAFVPVGVLTFVGISDCFLKFIELLQQFFGYIEGSSIRTLDVVIIRAFVACYLANSGEKFTVLQIGFGGGSYNRRIKPGNDTRHLNCSKVFDEPSGICLVNLVGFGSFFYHSDYCLGVGNHRTQSCVIEFNLEVVVLLPVSFLRADLLGNGDQGECPANQTKQSGKDGFPLETSDFVAWGASASGHEVMSVKAENDKTDDDCADGGKRQNRPDDFHCVVSRLCSRGGHAHRVAGWSKKNCRGMHRLIGVNPLIVSIDFGDNLFQQIPHAFIRFIEAFNCFLDIFVDRMLSAGQAVDDRLVFGYKFHIKLRLVESETALSEVGYYHGSCVINAKHSPYFSVCTFQGGSKTLEHRYSYLTSFDTRFFCKKPEGADSVGYIFEVSGRGFKRVSDLLQFLSACFGFVFQFLSACFGFVFSALVIENDNRKGGAENGRDRLCSISEVFGINENRDRRASAGTKGHDRNRVPECLAPIIQFLQCAFPELCCWQQIAFWVALPSKEIANKHEISSPTDTTGFECRASLPPSQQRWKGMDMRKRKSSTLLTVKRAGRMVRPIGGKNPPWGRRNSLFLTASRHVSCGYFCARNPGASSRLGREGGEYKTLRGNKPACLRTGFEPPATSAVVENLVGGVVKRRPEGFDMTDDIDGRIPSGPSQTTTDNAPVRGLSRAERAAINRRATDVATMLFPYVRDYMTRSAMDRLRASDKLKISALPMPPDIGLMIARYRTFGVDGFDPRDPTGHRRVCSVGAAMTLIEVIKTLREIADEITPETVLTDEGNDWVRDQIGATLSGLLSIEIDAGLL